MVEPHVEQNARIAPKGLRDKRTGRAEIRMAVRKRIHHAMQRDPAFEERMKRAGLTPEHHIYFICRSGQRSISACQALEHAGFGEVYNIVEGFEGPLDDHHHRNEISGWRKEGLPWEQS